MISKACYVAVYRKKLEELARNTTIRLMLIVPPYWRMGRKKAMLEPGEAPGYRMAVENPLFNGRFHLHFYHHLGKYLREFQPDIVHIDEEPYDMVALHALWLGRKMKARVLFFTWQNIYRRFPPPFGLMESYVLRHADGGIAGSREAAGVIRRKGYSRALAVIPQFGVDPEVFKAPTAKEPHGELLIGYVGRLVPEKGIMTLLEAVAALPGEWRLSLIGDGPMRADLPRIVHSLGLSERVTLVGGIPSEEVPHYLRQMDVLVLPSLTTPHWKEQFGRVLIEAMDCGVAVLGSSSGEIPHIIGDAGLVFAEGEEGDLREQLCRLRDPRLRQELAVLGRQRVLDHYTHKRVAEETARFYEEVMGGA